MNEKKYFYILFFIVFVIVNFGTGCSTTARSRGDPGAGDYIRPANLDESNYAIRERIYNLERQLADAIGRAEALEGRIAGAQGLVSEIKKSSLTIRELSRRSVSDVQGIIEKMEALVLWIDWITGYIQHLENILADQI